MFYANVNCNIGLFFEDLTKLLFFDIIIDAIKILNSIFVNFRTVNNMPESVEGEMFISVGNIRFKIVANNYQAIASSTIAFRYKSLKEGAYTKNALVCLHTIYPERISKPVCFIVFLRLSSK